MNGLKLTDLEERILSVVPSTSSGLSTKEICERLSGEYDHKDIDRAMNRLRVNGLIVRKTRGTDRRIRWVSI